MSFQQGLSGLNAAAKNLDIIGNNVANSNTVGFKQAEAQFADVYANSLTGSGGSQVGIGTKVAAVVQQFSQGNVTATENPLDVAINGAGFFRLSDNGGTITYSRNGQFHLDSTGYVVNSTGARLTGFTANAGGRARHLGAGRYSHLHVGSGASSDDQCQCAAQSGFTAGESSIGRLRSDRPEHVQSFNFGIDL